jgi:hypothetical protein
MLKTVAITGGGGGGGTGNITIQVNGANVGSQSNINFVSGTNIVITGTNDTPNSAIALVVSGGVSYPWFMS